MGKILIAPDSFKDALPALEVSRAIARGIHAYDPGIEVQLFPLADGGEGTFDILNWHHQGAEISVTAHDPLFRPIEASYGLSKDGRTAFIEMAKASGLELLKKEERNAQKTSSYGTGELILDAVKRGAQTIILGIGGSATNDGGMGMAAALGCMFLDENGKSLEPIGENLGKIHKIDTQTCHFDPQSVAVHVACDVDNPLFGPKGAAFVYGPQKGADPGAVALLDQGLRTYAKIIHDQLGVEVAQVPGAGAAGGMGAGVIAFLGAKLFSGIDLVMRATGFERALEEAQVLITGEGRIDRQTIHGKLIAGLSQKAKACKVPVVAFCGGLEADINTLKKLELAYARSIVPKPISLEEAIEQSAELLEIAAFNFISLWEAAKKKGGS